MQAISQMKPPLIVVPIGAAKTRRMRTTRIERLEPAEHEVRWAADSLPTPEHDERFLRAAIEGQPYESVVQSLWAHHPDTFSQAQRLAAFVTPCWEMPQGEPVVAQALKFAGAQVMTVLHERAGFAQRVLGAYLHGLLRVDAAVGCMSVRGLDRDGKIQRWRHFSMPLRDWVRVHGMTEIMVGASEDLSSEWGLGIRQHMMAAIADPVSIGYMLKYAPLG